MSLMLSPFSIQTKRLNIAGLAANRASLKKPVIAIHGWLDNAASFIPLSQYLKTDRPVYIIELPGHGLSEHRSKSSNYHLVENVVDVLAFIDALEIEESKECSSVSLVGHSLGGIVGSLVAASSPDLIDQLILLDSLGPLTDDLEQVLPQLRKAVDKAMAFSTSRKTVYPDIERAIKVRMMGVGRVSHDAAKLLCERGLKAQEGGYVWTSDSRLLAPSFVRFSEGQVKEIFAGVECPVNLITGDKGYFSTREAIAQRLEYFTNMSHFTVNGGHHFHMDGDVEGTANLIDSFLDVSA